MRLGVVILPEDPWPVAREKWRRAEELGFDHAWTYDHIAWSTLRDEPWFGALPTLTAAATVTTTLRLGTLVASPNFRHPVPFARDLTALDDVSGGRVVAGIGAGGRGWDATVLGQDEWSVRDRSDRFAEFVDLLDRLLREPRTTYAGRFWSANDAPMAPGCVQQPRIPFALAAEGPRSMRVVARHAHTWVTTGGYGHEEMALSAEEGAAFVQQQIAMLEDACRAEGRDPSTVGRLVLTGLRLDSGFDDFEHTKRVYSAAGVTDLVVHWPRATEPYRNDAALLERIMQ